MVLRVKVMSRRSSKSTIWFISFLLKLMCGSSAAIVHVNIVTLGYVYPTTLTSLAYSGPALDIAVENVKRNSKFNYTVSYLVDKRIMDCDQLYDQSEFILSDWFYRKQPPKTITAILVPACVESSLIGRLATAWNTVFITSVNAHAVMRNKQLSPTWISTAYIAPFGYIQLYLNLLARYNWSSIFIVVDDGSVPFYGAFASLLSSTSGRRLQVIRRFSSKVSPMNSAVLLQEFQSISRVLLFFGRAMLLRQLLIVAASKNMTNGEYVYVGIEPFPHKFYDNMTWEYKDENDALAKEAFRSLIVAQPLASSEFPSERNRLLGVEIAHRSNISYNFSYPLTEQPFPIIIALYSAFQTLDQVLNGIFVRDPKFDFSNGREIAKSFFNRTFTTDVGDIYFDEAGERHTDLALSYFDQVSGNLKPFLVQLARDATILIQIREIDWPNGNWPPRNEPICGYLKKSLACQLTSTDVSKWMSATVILAIIFLALTFWICFLYYRKTKHNLALLDRWWQIDSQEISMTSHHPIWPKQINLALKSSFSNRSLTEGFVSDYRHAQYKGGQVFLYPVLIASSVTDINTTQSTISTNINLLLTLRQLREFVHQNINRFYGITALQLKNQRVTMLVGEFAAKGSIHDLFGTSLDLDWQFIGSFAMDLLAGTQFIHQSSFGFHGRLTSKQCVIDRYFTLKIAAIAYDRLERELQWMASEKTMDQKFIRHDPTNWTAPEVLRGEQMPNQKSDIYSLGVILLEIVTRKAPTETFDAFVYEDHSSRMSSNGTMTNFGPLCERFFIPPQFEAVLQSCWDKNQENRPSISVLTNLMVGSMSDFDTNVNTTTGLSLPDKIIRRLAAYSEELEKEVLKRTNDLIDERAKCDSLLSHILPPAMVELLRTGCGVIPEVFENVTVLFSRLSGFDSFAVTNSPYNVTKLLSTVEVLFDELMPDSGIYKVEAVSDTYMVASGVPTRSIGQDAKDACTFALTMQKGFNSFSSVCELNLAVGLHSGPCAAGIIGVRRPRYCLFGDTVNTASRMCSYGEPGRTQISSATAERVQIYPQFRVEERGLVNIKGKENMFTYWLEIAYN